MSRIMRLGRSRSPRTARKADEKVRQCAVTRDRRPRDELIRFVLSPEGEVVPDLEERIPGRGVWTTATRQTLETAVRKGVFSRAFRQQAKAGAALPEQVDKLLAKQALQAFSLAIKSGEIVLGFAKIEEAIRRRNVAALVHASDGAADGKRKLNAALMRRHRQASDPVEAFNSAELGLASGRTNVIHAALIEGGASARFLQKVGRLMRFRGETGHPVRVSESRTED